MKYFLSSLIMVLFGGAVSAQVSQNPGEAFIQQANVEHNEAVQQFTSDFATTFSMDFDSFDEFDVNANVGIINQFGSGNSSFLLQTGIGNMARLNILGHENSADVLQSGNSNQFILNLEGGFNALSSEQVGDENRLRLDIIGTAHNQQFFQNGNGLSMEVFESGNGGGVPIIIEQNGNGGGTVIIENY
ncbi:hypothetical protein DYD21_04675 [Rhodohalobacter sp. SW132]|uniref:hypothetical protein n=1 Tax=Rhodohalobacter sp. SW132 TaxID=2293433 RepID=UPI000E391D94|nr:hypothetical protein [Rhodohalobacter sp. SW132]REL39251.1 hypothetical protein DYD21_04675 [Rhodohalobacter sp. SW132]